MGGRPKFARSLVPCSSSRKQTSAEQGPGRTWVGSPGTKESHSLDNLGLDLPLQPSWGIPERPPHPTTTACKCVSKAEEPAPRCARLLHSLPELWGLRARGARTSPRAASFTTRCQAGAPPRAGCRRLPESEATHTTQPAPTLPANRAHPTYPAEGSRHPRARGTHRCGGFDPRIPTSLRHRGRILRGSPGGAPARSSPLRTKGPARPAPRAAGRAPSCPRRPPACRVPGGRCPRRHGGLRRGTPGLHPAGPPPHWGAAVRRPPGLPCAPDRGSPSAPTLGPSAAAARARNSVAEPLHVGTIFTLPQLLLRFLPGSTRPAARSAPGPPRPAWGPPHRPLVSPRFAPMH